MVILLRVNKNNKIDRLIRNIDYCNLQQTTSQKMQFSQNLSNHPDFRQQKSKSKNKMLKSRNTHSQKSSLKNISNSTNKFHSQLTYQIKTSNFLIKEKYFKPAMKQYQRSDANMITRCIERDFQDFQGRTMNLFQFVKFYTIKQNLKKYQKGINQNYKQKYQKLSPTNFYNLSIYRHIFHFYDKTFLIFKNRMLKLRNLQAHHSVLRSQKGSSIKNSDRKKQSLQSKSKNKYKNMDNLLKGIFNTKTAQKSTILSKIKKINKLPEPRQTHVVSKDSQDMNLLLNQLSNLLKAHSIQNYSEMSTQQDIPLYSNDFPPTFSYASSSNINSQQSKLSQLKQVAKNNEFTQIMQYQYSHISAIKSSQIMSSPDQYQFYGLSSIRDKKIKKQQKNSTKNQSYFAKGQRSANQSRLTNKRISTHLQLSNIFSEQTPKKLVSNQLRPQIKQDDPKKSKSRSRTLRKGLNEKSKSKSLSSTQKSLKKDQSTGFIFKNTKLLSNTKSTKNISQRLLFMEPLNQKQIRKPHLLGSLKTQQQRKQSKSKSKGKLLLIKR